MPWASKPAANTVPVGTRLTVSDQRMTDWVSNGTHWYPESGRQIVHLPNLSGATAQSATLALVAAVPGWQMPTDMANIPNLYIEALCICTTSSASSQQQRQLYIGTSADNNCIATLVNAAATNARRMWGKTHRRFNADHWEPFASNAGHVADGSGRGPTTAASLLASPIQLYYRGGATDGSEVLTIANFCIAVGTGP